MAPKEILDMMVCAICGKSKSWRDGFPDSTYAECWSCAWKAHLRDEHKPSWLKRRKSSVKGVIRKRGGQQEADAPAPPRSTFIPEPLPRSNAGELAKAEKELADAVFAERLRRDGITIESMTLEHRVVLTPPPSNPLGRLGTSGNIKVIPRPPTCVRCNHPIEEDNCSILCRDPAIYVHLSCL